MISNYPLVIEDSIIEGQDCTLQGRFESAAGTPLTQAGVTSVSYYVYNYEDSTAIANGSFVVASVIYDGLQQWSEDCTGYNFEATIPWAKLNEDGDFIYWIEVLLMTPGGETIPALYKIHQHALLSLP